MPHGFVNVYKPAGMSSQQVVQRIRRLTHERHVGHAGTLDPDATGVLPIAVGQYTRLLEWASLTPKVYRAHIVFGHLTHSGDQSGTVVGESGPPFPERDSMAEAFRWLTGDILQFPPQVSALKQQGRRAYDMVRRGHSVWLDPRVTHIDSITILDGAGRRWYVEAMVGSGTYIRALARDAGFIVGHAAALESLERTRVGKFSVDEAWTLGELEAEEGRWRDALVSGPQMLDIAAHPVTPSEAESLRRGKSEGIPALREKGPVALICDGEIVAVVDGPPWHFRKVLVKDEE